MLYRLLPTKYPHLSRKMLRCVVTDAFVSPAQRWQWYIEGVQAGTLVEETTNVFQCPWGCGAAGAEVDHRHLFWACPSLGSSQIPEVAGSSRLTRRALAAIDAGDTVFWLRGIVPLQWAHNTAEPPLEAYCCHGDAAFAATAASIMATDGGGGLYSADPRRRRCTFGYAVIRLHLDADGWLEPPPISGQCQRLAGAPGNWLRLPSSVPRQFDSEALKILANFTQATGRCASATVLRLVHGRHGGPRQTVPRAELAAIRVAVQLEAPRAWTILSDHANHVEAWQKGRGYLLASPAPPGRVERGPGGRGAALVCKIISHESPPRRHHRQGRPPPQPQPAGICGQWLR